MGVDDNGLGGLEQKFDAQLHGVPGEMFTAMDARRQVLGSSEHEPEPGRNMVLTIDENIQFMAENALDHAMETHQGRSTARSWCRTCIPARFWRSPFGPLSIPTIFATPRPNCCVITR